tara:strand:- start:2596 stop:2775 length:180 start_codon:yes stop_codon:yes gene_type:complete
MIVRNHNNKLITIDEKEYINEKSLYSKLWKTKYNKILPKLKTTSIKNIGDYITGKKISL